MRIKLDVRWLLVMLLLTACSTQIQRSELALGAITEPQLLNRFPNFGETDTSFVITRQQQQQIAGWPTDLSIQTYFATWCHDSQREVPRLLKILAYNAKIEHSLIALDASKTEPTGAAQAAHIQFTPTIIISLAGRELGRITERPKQTLVDDINVILANR